MMMNNLMIKLPHDKNKEFPVSRLLQHLTAVRLSHIIQGQQQVVLGKHTKPNSLDYWIRRNIAIKQDTKQAVNEVIEQLIETRLFEEGKFVCPDSGRKCKGIKVKESIFCTLPTWSEKEKANIKFIV